MIHYVKQMQMFFSNSWGVTRDGPQSIYVRHHTGEEEEEEHGKEILNFFFNPKRRVP